MILTRRNLLRVVFDVNAVRTPKDTLVCVFLRGGADGLNLVVPFEEKAYYKLRPSLGIARPDQTSGDKGINLDGKFALNPKLAPMKELWDEKCLAIIHAAGSEDQTRSHFEAQDLMERASSLETGVSGGWLARHFQCQPAEDRTPLMAVGMGPSLPETLRGAPVAMALESFDEFHLGRNAGSQAALAAALDRLYGHADPDLARSGRQSLSVLDTLDKMRLQPYVPAGGAKYPEGEYGQNLLAVARLIKAGVGLEAATVDLNGWDSHFGQAVLIDGLQEQLAQGLAAFRKDLGAHLAHTTVVVMTEFGRRAYENTAFGTDHGRASCMFVMGGAVKGGRVIADWPGLEEGQLEEPGDLKVTTDYRDVLAEILAKRSGQSKLDKVFPGHEVKFRGVFA
ncbi:MAG: hypothetical protein FD180_4212 [Planctomycetota bacterium]|nr:MAG: hypothetical protein FD180_4212 [Planctomycetota bacterium]